jgi:hypothetical protein
MSQRHTALRSMHDLGLAAWFGGSLMGAVGVNGAAAQVSDTSKRLPTASAGWARWRPFSAAAIGTHLVGAAGELVKESPRVMAQSGVGRMTAIKTGLTAAALSASGYSGLLGRKLEKANGVPVDGPTEPNHQTPPDVAAAQRQMKLLQWAIPALTGALIVVTAYAGEQQRPGQVFQGMIGRMGGIMPGMMRGGRGMRMMPGMMRGGRRMRMMPGMMRGGRGMRMMPGMMRGGGRGMRMMAGMKGRRTQRAMSCR